MQAEEGSLLSSLFLWREKRTCKKWRVNIQILCTADKNELFNPFIKEHWLYISRKSALLPSNHPESDTVTYFFWHLQSSTTVQYLQYGAGFARHQAFQQEKCHLPCSHSCLCIEAFRSYLFCWGPNHGLNMGVFLHGYCLNVSRQTWIIASSGPNISSYTFCDLKKESNSSHSWGLQCKVLKVRLSLKSKIKLKINNKNIFHISFLPLHQVLKF